MVTPIKIDDELKNRVRQQADIKNRSAHWIMCEAIREHIEREEKKESFKQEALASWKAYQETGRYLTAQEVQNWLQTCFSASKRGGLLTEQPPQLPGL